MGWKEIVHTNLRDLQEEQKDELCKNIVDLDDIDDINLNKLKKLFRITQDMLKYKDDQVELLITELDELARKQGVEEAKIIQSLENEIKSLKSSTESRLQTPDHDLMKENENLRIKNKTLKVNYKRQIDEIDKLKHNLLSLQEEKNMLQSELVHSAERESDSQSESSEISEKYQQLTESIRQKNRQISQLLNDIEIVEKENIILKEKVVALRDDLEEATKHLSTLTIDISGQKNGLKETKEKLINFSEENLALRNRIEDLVQQKQERETELENFTGNLDEKIDELKNLLDDKQNEIHQLKEENLALNKQLDNLQNSIIIPIEKLSEKDDQIEELQNKLLEAVKEIEHNTILLNNISSSRQPSIVNVDQNPISEDLKSQLTSVHERCKELQSLLQAAEEDAQNRGQELIEVLSQLKRYEEGQYGLSDALREMQDLRVQIKVRDKQISELIASCNQLQCTYDEIEHDNQALREKCGLPLDAPISKNTVMSRQRKQRKLINNLQNQIEILEDEKLQIKVELQKCKRMLCTAESGRETAELQKKPKYQKEQEVRSEKAGADYKKKFAELTEENEALRKGMHEILESIRAKKGSSSKEIKSESLEKLIHILDSRHVSGWYHPAMKLQAEINTLQGTNEELRNQLKISRHEIKESAEQLHQTEIKLKEHEQKIKNVVDQKVDYNQIIALEVPANMSATSADIISKLNSHLLLVLNEYHTEVENSESLKAKLETYKREVSVIKQQISLLYKQFIEEKKLLVSKNDEMASEKENLQLTISDLKTKVQNYIKTDKNGDAAFKITNDLVQLNRKCLFLEENDKKFSLETAKLRLEMSNARTLFTETLKGLELSRNGLRFKVNILENHLRDSVPKYKIEHAKKEIYDLTTKYQELLQNLNNFQESNSAVLYKKEIENLNAQKDSLYFELLQIKSKSYAVDYANDEIVNLSKKLANLELNELSERQRADHINSLYDLVKEQLRKCEERCAEYDSQNKMLINSNLKLQVGQQELQDKLINCVTQEDHNAVKDKIDLLKEELENIKTINGKLKTRNSVLDNELKTKEMLKSINTMEIMNLKHLVLDLQSTNDEKALIARLSTEVVLARICEADAKNKLEILNCELQEIKHERKEQDTFLRESYEKLNNVQNQFQTKYRTMEDVMHSLRSQYLGCNTLYTMEGNMECLRQIYNDKQRIFNELQIAQQQKNEIILLQEQLNVELKNVTELKSALSGEENGSDFDKVLEWHKEKSVLQLNEFKWRRNLEMKEEALAQSLQRIQNQNREILNLKEELIKISNNMLNKMFNSNSILSRQTSSTSSKTPSEVKTPTLVDTGINPCLPEIPKAETSTQTIMLSTSEKSKYDEVIARLENEVLESKQLISLKDKNLERQEILINDLEKKLENYRQQLTENQTSEITTREREPRNQVNVIDDVDVQEHNALKHMVNKLQVMITQKEATITKYESLLKEHRDEHSLAAARFQEDIKQLQSKLAHLQHINGELKNTKLGPNKEHLPNMAAIEQYVSQVHSLESHMADMQTSVSSLSSQLQASRQESVRWRTLANDRLNSIESLRKEFDTQNEEEISTYKNETNKYKDENIALKQELSKYRVQLNQKSSDINLEVQERDAKIHELTMTNMQLQNEVKIHSQGDAITSSEYSELEMAKQLLEVEFAALKKRYDQLLNKEMSAREEIRNLKSQLIKRPILSVRTDRGDKTMKDQLQKKIANLEKELSEANERLEREATVNEMRRVKISEDFALWEKQKKWQQTAEKCKEKLASKTEELEKVQQSYSSAKAIVSRLEREKHILECKLKQAKSSTTSLSNTARMEFIEQENIRLQTEIQSLSTKLEMQQYHSGALGAAMLQEKLEAQERKIAVLELSAKGTIEVTAELERLHSTIASLQKTNLRLEAENLELNLDFKKASGDIPFLREQIQHLERYIDVLKSEQSELHVVTNAGDQLHPGNKKISELEKTVLSLKRLVEKLQAENKRLQSRPCSSSSDRKVTVTSSADKYQQELKKIRDQYAVSVLQSEKLETELSKSQKRVRFLENVVGTKQAENESSLSTELAEVRAQLAHKSQLLDKVKILLQKAALKEKFLLDQNEQLKQALYDKTEEQLLANEETTNNSNRQSEQE